MDEVDTPVFQGTHVGSAKVKHYRWTDRQKDNGQSDPYVVLYFAGATKIIQ